MRLNRYIRIVFTIILLTLFKSTFADNRFRHLNIEDGIAHTDVTCITQDQSGLIWIGTYAGLQSYDGYQTKLYDYYPKDQVYKELHNRLQAITTLGDKLWIGSQSGLTLFSTKTDRYVEYSAKGIERCSLNRSIMNVAAYNDSAIWIKTDQDSKVAIFNEEENSLEVLEWDDNAKSIAPNIITLARDKENVWLATKSTLYTSEIKENKVSLTKVYDNKNAFYATPFNIVNLYYKNSNIYIRLGKGCVKVPINGDNTLNYEQSQALNYTDICHNISLYGKAIVDNNGTIWNSTANGLLQIDDPFSDPKLTIHTHSEMNRSSLSSNFISTLFLDSCENLWIGTWGQGINVKSTLNAPFNSLTYNDNTKTTINGQFVKDIEDAPNGDTWVITQDGALDRLDSESNVVFSTTFPSIDIDIKYFQCLKYLPSSEKLYIGMMQGLFSYDTQTHQTEWIIGGATPVKAQIPQMNVYDIATDKYNRLWVATWQNGLFCVDDRGSKARIVAQLDDDTTKPMHLSSNVVTSVEYLAQSNELYICTNNGIDRLQLNNKGEVVKCAHYRATEDKEQSLSNNFISSIKHERDSIFWVGTLGGGVCRMVVNSFNDNDYTAEIFSQQNGLPSNNAEMIEIDASNNVWVGGYGISMIEHNTHQIHRYNSIDGLHGDSFKIGASHTSQDGTIFMGGQNGLTYFDPALIQFSESKNSIILTDLYIHNHIVEPTTLHNGTMTLPQALNYVDGIELHHDQNDFSLSFAALGARVSNRVLYRYRLIGYESEWKSTPLELNKAFYSNLDYGHYVFELQLSNDNGYTWNESSMRQIDITILPPWWLNPFAQLSYSVLLTIIIIILVYRYLDELRMKQTILIANIEKEKTEENHQLKLQFFMNISHELKTPLTIILSSIERLELEAKGERSIKENNYYTSIERNANKLLSLINELVDFRKHDLGIAPNNYVYTDISKVIYDMAIEFTPWTIKKGLALTVENDASIETAFDEEKITKVFCNLLSNAIKYTEEGEIEISIKRGESNNIKPRYKSVHTERSYESSFEAVIITIADSGIGITPASINKIYDRYFQVINRTSVHLGSGIGLAVAKSMVLSQYGNITVSSERNVGTEFIICIPILARDAVENCNVATRESNDGFDVRTYVSDQHLEYNYTTVEDISSQKSLPLEERNTLLLVEDNVELLESLREYFSTQYNVLTAENGAIGLQLCTEHHPDIVVSDVMMPEMSGTEMCSQIRENLSIAYTPIILLTAKSDVEHQIEGYEAGADHYIPKPFSLRVLELNIARLIANKLKMMAAENDEPTPEESTSEAVEEQAAEVVEAEAEPVTVAETREDIKKSKDRLFIDKMNDYIYANLSNPDLSVSQLCNELCVGRTKLYSQVKEICGQSLGDYIRDIRLKQAAKLLRTTDMNIIEIIYEVGFGSNSHFSKVFKARYGVTPTEYTKQKDPIE